MFRIRRIYILIMVFVGALALASTPIVRGEEDTLYNNAPIYKGDALVLDAKGYAEEHGIELDEAVHRLQLQGPAGELNAVLITDKSSTFAGAWIQHSPEFRIIVQFTHNGEEAIRPYIESGPLANIVDVRRADVTLMELDAAQTTTLLTVRRLGIPIESGINVQKNRVELYTIDEDRLTSALQEANIELPSKVTVVPVSELSTEELDIYAGFGLTTCTSGFSVENSSGTKGITTAAHCQDSQAYNGTSLPFQGAAYGGQYDVQWHTAPGFNVRNLMYDGSINRVVNSTKHRNSQVLWEYICKHGQTTGFTCGYIIDKNYNPGGSHTSTFIRVHRDGVNLSSGGDSGSPWFSGNTAYGIHKGGIGNDAYYMAVNYISFLGLNVLTN